MVGDSERFLEDNLVRHRDLAHWAVPATIVLALTALSFFAYGEYFSRDFKTFGETLQTVAPDVHAQR